MFLFRCGAASLIARISRLGHCLGRAFDNPQIRDSILISNSVAACGAQLMGSTSATEEHMLSFGFPWFLLAVGGMGLMIDNPFIPIMSPEEQAWWLSIDGATLAVGLILINCQLLKSGEKRSTDFVLPS
jgi:hypothetical protein